MERNRITLHWTIISIIIGTIGAALSLLYVSDILFAMPIGIALIILMLFLNPRLFYMRVFYSSLSTLIILNGYYFSIQGELIGQEYVIKSPSSHILISLILTLLMLLALTFYFLERNGIIPKWPKFPVNIIFNFGTKTVNNFIYVEGGKIKSQDSEISIEDIQEIKGLVEEETKISSFLQEATDEDLARRKELIRRIESTKKEVEEFVKATNVIEKSHPEDAKELGNRIMKGNFGGAKEYLDFLNEKRRDEKIASILGISYDEICEITFEVEIGHETDGMIYYYNIWIEPDAPQDIIGKIDRIEKIGDRYCYEASPWDFSDEEDYR